jgi:putative tryptophan/tyrosine transport system substrate-binding protein
MTCRRLFIRCAAAGLWLATSASRAQTAGRVYRLGWLRSIVPSASDIYSTGVPRALRRLGWIEGQNLSIEVRYAEGRMERMPALARELVALPCDAIIAGGSGATRAAMAATRTIPIIMVGNFDPVALGFVTSLGRPGGNVTGVLAAAEGSLAGKKLELLKEIAPRARCIAILASDDPNLGAQVLETREAASMLGVELHVVQAYRGDYSTAFAKVEAERCGALLVGAAPFSLRDRRSIIELAAKHRLPAIWEWREQVEDGGLMAYGASLDMVIQREAEYVDRIFKGTPPADLPVDQPSTVKLVINLKTARALGLTIPQSMLLRADEVIE